MDCIRVLLIDDDEAFCHLFETNLAEHTDDFSIDVRIANSTDDPQIAENNVDVYLVDHHFYGRPMAPEIVERIRDAGGGKIFVISKFGDFSLLKELLKLGIDGFIDKDEIDYAEFVKFCQSIAQTKVSLQAITRKLGKLGEG